MENTTYALRPLLAEIRDGFRGMHAIRTSRRAAELESARAATGGIEGSPSRPALRRGSGIHGSGR